MSARIIQFPPRPHIVPELLGGFYVIRGSQWMALRFPPRSNRRI